MRSLLLIATALFLLLPGCTALTSLRLAVLGVPHLERIVYLSDPSTFTNEQLEAIDTATHDIEVKTAHIVHFTVRPYDPSIRLDDRSVVIFNVPISDPRIVRKEAEVDQKQHVDFTLLGLCEWPWAGDPGSIYMVASRLPREDDYRVVATHELLHSLKLNHNPSTDSIMYEDFNRAARSITVLDQVAFCKVWGCDALVLTAAD